MIDERSDGDIISNDARYVEGVDKEGAGRKVLSKNDEPVAVDRRKVLALLGSTGVAMIAGMTHVNAAVKEGGPASFKLQFYENLASLREDKQLKKGNMVVTSGYHSRGDGGGGMYNILEPGRGMRPDWGGIIALDNGLWAVLAGANFVSYKMFGAGQSSRDDDGPRIKAAHEYANKNDLPVINLNGEYWIKETNGIVIKTNVQWGHSVFHLNEKYNSKKTPRFLIQSREARLEIKLSFESKKRLLAQVKPGVKIIPELAPYKNSLVFISDGNDKIGYRAGGSFKGQHHVREEFFYVEEGGRIIGDVAWEFDDYTSLVAYPCDSNYLIVDGGTFYLSGDNPGKTYDGYWKNGFSITRSRTIIRNQWMGLERGNQDISLTPHSGFYAFSRTYDVALENVRLIPWIQDREGKDEDVAAGTYGIGCGRTLKSRFFNVIAEGAKGYWGVFGTNLNKDFLIDQCTLNRVDVHFHCWNLHIKNSSIGYKGITVTGGGKLIIENTIVWARRYFLSFRRDFGSKWDGDIYISNCRYMPSEEGETAILNFSPANFNYHYSIGFGRIVRVDNFIIDYKNVPNSQAACWLMKVASFSTMKDGERLFFPNQLSFSNIAVEGREKGVRLVSVRSPQSYKQPMPGGYDGEVLRTNSKLLFNNIQLERIESKQPRSLSDVHLFLNAHSRQPYMDNYALYPDIWIINCDNFIGTLNGAANIRMDHCNIQRMEVGLVAALEGGVAMQDCSLKPVIMETDKPPFFRLSAKSAVNFTNCLFLSPEVGGVSRPDLFNGSGIIEINKMVRYNHLNSRISNIVREYCDSHGVIFNEKFISMLTAHNEMEK